MEEKTQRKKVDRRVNKFSIAPPTPNLKPAGKPLNSKAAARYLNTTKNTLFSLCRQCLITYYLNGNAFEFYIVHLDDFKFRCMRNGG